ncbi:MAG: flavin reductase family protein [Tistlia sp.]|uniref:flavin reductase family protein n=1 Tax=Tistlia sp. TaxID=3057121 RepID=UPI0034A41357
MFFKAGEHKAAGLPYNPFKALVVPRPIGWISTLNEDGSVNLAPYSFFNALADRPPIVFFSPNGRSRAAGVKDSQRNAEAQREFVCSLATWDLRDAMNASAEELPPGVSEPEKAGIEMAASRLVAPPRVAASPVALECRWLQTLELPSWDAEGGNFTVIGEVVGFHIAESALTPEGLVDSARLKPIARLGYRDYALTDSAFTMARPGETG